MGDTRSLVGKTLGHYRIESVLGEGGMGMVYLAFDRRLERRVAIKVLRPEALSDPDRKRRFVQEAKSASALNHPNIVTIHDIAQQDGADYIVMEYIEGATLTLRMKEAALPVAEALDYATQVASALARAHAAGIVHRDIKPDNIIVNKEGRGKILDFGIAKLIDAAEPAQPRTGILGDVEREGTLLGAVLGTAEYMSPEQARGAAADARSDIFSFGALLYEMLTGRRAFAAPTKYDAMQAVLYQEPPTTAMRKAPPKMAAIALRCLRKEPTDRFQTMAEVLQALEKAQEKKWGWWWAWAIPLTFLLLLLALGLVFPRIYQSSTRPRTNIIPVTTYPGQEIEPAISPDGTRVAFLWDGDNGKLLNLYVKAVEGGEPLRLTNGAQLEAIPVWSPNGKEIAFLRRHPNGDGLFDVLIIPANGGAERKIAVSARGLDWSPDGQTLVIMEPEPRKPRGLLLLTLATGETHRLTTAPEGVQADRSPRFSPDGKSVAFSRAGYHNESTICVVPVKGGELKRLFDERRGTLGLDWTADGREIVYAWASVAAQPSLYRIPLSGGVPEAILSQAYNPSIARRANRMAIQQTIHNQNIWRIARPGPLENGADRAARGKQLIASSQTNNDMQYSLDGTKIAFNSQRTGNAEIWVADANGRHATQITSGKGKDLECGSPRFSADSRQLVFDCHTASGTDIYTLGLAEAESTPRRLTTDRGSFVPGFTRDGKWIFYTSEHERHEIWRIPSGGGAPQQVTKNGGYEAKESIAGGMLYYSKTAGGDAGLWTVPVEGGAETQVAGLPTNLFRRNWDVCSAGIAFVRAGSDVIEFFDFKTRKIAPVYPLEKVLQVFNRNLAISPDCRSVLWAQVDVDSRDISVVDHFR